MSCAEALPPAAPGAGTASRGVFIVGMHRSGTSATSRALNLLGVPLCREDDLVEDRHGNPTGHWESATLLDTNERLLHELGHSPWSPPPADQPDAALTRTSMPLADARQRFRSAHPTTSWVAKDPRTCLTLSFWRAALPGDHAAVLVLRRPSEVSASLCRRNRFPASWGYALWERYLRLALAQAAGLPTLVTRYDDLLDDPAAWSWSVERFLREIELPLGVGDRRAVGSFVGRELRHHDGDDAPIGPGAISGTLPAVLDVVTALVGAHERLDPPELPPEDPAVQRVLDGCDGPDPARREETARAARRSRRPTTIGVVLTAAGHRIDADGDRGDRRALAALPPGSPVEVVAAAGDGVGRGATLNRAAAALHAELVAFVPSDVDAPAWEDLREALADPTVGAVSTGPPPAPGCGWVRPTLTFADRDLRLEWRVDHPVPAPAVPLLTDGVVAVRAEVLRRIGGLDEGFRSGRFEGVELALRLWRLGYRTLSLPHPPPHRALGPVTAEAGARLLHDRLRLGALHLPVADLSRQAARASHDPAFGRAAASVVAGDAGRRRAALDAVATRPAGWFFDRFAVPPAEEVA